MEHDGLLTTLKSILEIVILAIFIVTFLVQPFRIPSGSMEPTLRVGDFFAGGQAVVCGFGCIGSAGAAAGTGFAGRFGGVSLSC